MTLGLETPRIEYDTNGVTTHFPITFTYLDEADVKVIWVDSGGVETAWTQDLEYVIDAGEVVAVDAPETGGHIVVYRSTPLTQDVQCLPNKSLTAEVMERVLDKLTMLAAENAVNRERTLLVSEGYTGDAYDIETFLTNCIATAVSASIDAVNAINYSSHLVVHTIADLRLQSGTNPLDSIDVLGYYSVADGAGGHRRYWAMGAAPGTYVDTGGSIIVPTGGDGSAAWIWPTVPDIVSSALFGARGNNQTENGTLLNTAYQYAKANKKPFYTPAGFYRFSTNLDFDGSIDVLGDGIEKTVFVKHANVVGMTIDGNQCKYTGWQLTCDYESDTCAGIIANNLDMSVVENIYVDHQGGNGIHIRNCTASKIMRVSSRYNKGSGLVIDYATGIYNPSFINANSFDMIDALGNDEHGVWIKNGDNNYNAGYLTVQQNGKHGAFIESTSNEFTIYGERNNSQAVGPEHESGTGAYYDIYLSSSSIRNLIKVISVTSNDSIYDAGTNNQIMNFGSASAWSVSQLSPRKKNTNTDGRDKTIKAGDAGDGAEAKPGGTLYLGGGDADGTGNRKGGDIRAFGGQPAGTEDIGYIYLQEDGTAMVIVGAELPTTTQASLELGSTVKVLFLNRLDAAAVTALGTIGMGAFFYNKTTHTFQGSINGVRHNFTTTPA